jgi:LAO/AO transport system kinase
MDIKQMLTLGATSAAKQHWRPPVIGVSCHSGEGLDALVSAIEQHHSVVFDTECGARRRFSIANFRLQKTAENLLLERFFAAANALAPVFAERLVKREADPYSLATELLSASLR